MIYYPKCLSFPLCSLKLKKLLINKIDMRSANINIGGQLLFTILNFAPNTNHINIGIKCLTGLVYGNFIHIFYPGKSKMSLCHYT